MNNAQLKPRLIKAPEAAAYLGISDRKLWQLTKEGRLPSVKFDRCVRYDQSDLDAFIESMKN